MAEKTHTIQEELSAPVEEAYRVLRSNIQFCSFDKKIKSLVVTSCQPGEGKSTTSHNLAISMAKTGMNVLLVDADLRKPSVEKLVGQNHTQGLSTLIAGHAMLEEVIHRTSIKGFSYIACGPKPPNPAELMGSEAFHVFLKAATEMFDLVIIDTPPLGSVIDCAIISAQVDGTLLVIQSHAIEYKEVERVKVQLEKANARILGVVLNKMKKSDYKGYYNYYKYYGAEDREKGFFNRFKPFKKSEKVFT
jgi:protein-tyrosine kinase